MKNNTQRELVSVIIPVFNELKNIEKLITRLSETLEEINTAFELIFIDDNSTDGTYEYLTRYKNSAKIQVHQKIGEKGKAYSLVQGFTHATGTILVMIDADLQYAPEAIPAMIATLTKGADIVVGNRKKFHASRLRSATSNIFRIAFGKILFDLPHDVQSGLKVFRKKVWETVHFTPKSGWSFDLEFLHRAREAGFVIKNTAIDFLPRENGDSKIGVMKTAVELATSSLRLKVTALAPQHIPSDVLGNMIGAGVGHKRKKYITHTTMPHQETAMTTFTTSQKIIMLLVGIDIILGFVSYPLITIQALVAVLSLIYFTDVLFNLFVVGKSISFPSEIEFSQAKLAALDVQTLPTYTILCPLYREAHVVPQFMDAIQKLEWPKNKLDVMLLLEVDDQATITAIANMTLPAYVRVVVVPDSIPKTKPKACNYGLSLARGEYLVIYDAEDIPEPLQLKKAYLGFQKVDKDVICLQAKLNYYNPHQNLLTRFFTTEYSLWFDVTLTGLQSLNTIIPLGGTSNHFRTEQLKSVQGWDPFNVTEDADLGMRLFKKGYRTAIIDSVTLEEANSKVGNWIRQRSRWIKGYMQTYLVHVREALGYTREKGPLHALIFHLVIGGKIMFIFLNPFLWITTIAYFSLYAYVGPSIEKVYPSLVFYMAAISLIFGNFLAIYYYMIGVAKKEKWELMKVVFLIPIYWLMTSIAGFVGLYQLIFKPHYWEKTVHGLHLKKIDKQTIAQAVIATKEAHAGVVFPNSIKHQLGALIARKKVYIGGMFLIAASMSANLLNFLFNAYLGRVLEFSDLALISLISGFLSISSILFSGLSTTVNFKSGYLIGKYGDSEGQNFWHYVRNRSALFSVWVALLWIGVTPFLMRYFGTNNPFPFLFFGAVLLVGFINGANRGLLYARLKFGSIALMDFLDPVIKLATAGALVYAGLKNWTFSAIPLGTLFAFLIGWMLIRKETTETKKNDEPTQEVKKFPTKFFGVSLLTGFSSVAFLTVDILLANHFLAPIQAGEYALLSLVGKMVFFLGGLTSPFITPLASRNEGANKSSEKMLSLLLLLTTALALVGFLAFGAFGGSTIPLLFGNKARAILPFLPFFTLGMVCYTISRIFISYYLVKRLYTFTIATSLLVFVQIAFAFQHHAEVRDIAIGTTLIWTLHLLTTAVLHIFASQVKTFENNIVDFFGLFAKNETKTNRNLAILIFNWRDTQHKWAGGAEVYIHELAKRWVAQGNSVTVFCGNSVKRPKNDNIDGVTIIRRGGFYTVYIWAFFYYIFKFRGKYDIIIDSENGIPFFTPLYAKEKTFLLIHHVHQEVFRKSLVPPFSWLALFLEAKLMPFVYKAVQVITVSPSSKDEILKHKLTTTDPIIIYNGVDLTKFVPGKKSETPTVLYVGRLQYYKSLDLFINAAKVIIEAFPTTEFVIAGEGEEKKKLQRLAEKLGIAKHVQFLGRVSEERKIALYQNAWVFVNPSFMEGWGITTIEANACGTPVVASNVPGLRDSIRHLETGLLVKERSANAFAVAIMTLTQDKKLNAALSKGALQWAQTFSWEESANDFYTHLVTPTAKKTKQLVTRGIIFAKG